MRGQVLRGTEPAGLVRFIEFGGYCRNHCDRVLARTSTRDVSHDVRVATMVAETRRVVQQSQEERFRCIPFKAWGYKFLRKVD